MLGLHADRADSEGARSTWGTVVAEPPKGDQPTAGGCISEEVVVLMGGQSQVMVEGSSDLQGRLKRSLLTASLGADRTMIP
jgi:hypothetical protein